MAESAARFSANRTVREYTDKFYLPAAAVYRQRATDKGRLGAHIPHWQRAQRSTGGKSASATCRGRQTVDQHVLQVPVYLGAIDPDAVQVEPYANALNGAAPLRQAMTRGERLPDVSGYVYSAPGRVATRPGRAIRRPVQQAARQGHHGAWTSPSRSSSR